uniref:Integrase core domain containing protein n=1 Tax=Solanum tuberosum TaxID=4113 RepID=M1DQL8_SOLTU
MTQLSTTVNPCQPGTLPNNTIQNPKNDGHCMIVTTRGGKQTIDPFMPSVVDAEMTKEDDVVEAREEFETATEQEAEISQKVVPIPRPPLPFSTKVHQEKSAENDLVQRSTDPIDSPSFNPRTVDDVRRHQDIVENGLRCGLANKDWLKPGTDRIHDTPSTDRRLGSWVDALENLTKCETTDVDQYCWSSDPRKGSTDRRSVYGPHASGSESAHASGSKAKSATGSSQDDQVASSNKATSSESVPAPRNEDPTPVAGDPNRWCVEGQWQIYRDAKMRYNKGKMARLITEERRVLTGSLHTVPDIHRATRVAPSSSQSTPQLGAIVVPLARVQKLEAQMATLLHHIQPWMQKSIAESEARMERRMEGMMDRMVQAVNKCLDAFELRVLERSASAIDLSSLQAELASVWTDVDAILAAPTVEPQAAPTALVDHTVLDALFSGTAEEGLEPTHAKGKRHRSNRTEEEKAQKRKHRQEKEARKALILDEQLRQQRVRESVAGASSSALVVEVPPVVRDVVSTIDSAMMDDVGTTEGDPTIAPACSGKPDPPARA